MASIKIYSKEQVDGLLPTSSQLVPSGGSTGQVLTKSASGTEWTTPSGGINVVQSTGSSTSDVMSQKAVTDNLPSSSQLVPTLGSAGQVLTVNSGATGTEWSTPSSGGASVVDLTTSNLVNEILNCDVGTILSFDTIGSPVIEGSSTKRISYGNFIKNRTENNNAIFYGSCNYGSGSPNVYADVIITSLSVNSSSIDMVGIVNGTYTSFYILINSITLVSNAKLVKFA